MQRLLWSENGQIVETLSQNVGPELSFIVNFDQVISSHFWHRHSYLASSDRAHFITWYSLPLNTPDSLICQFASV